MHVENLCVVALGSPPFTTPPWERFRKNFPLSPLFSPSLQQTFLFVGYGFFSTDLAVLQLHLLAGTERVAWLCFSLLQMHSEKNLQLVEMT